MYKNKQSITRNSKGITLVALVVTIVILIILAVISINAIIGENGLIRGAEKGKLEHEKAETRERIELVLADAFVEKNLNEKYDQNEFLDRFVEERLPGVIMTEDEIELNGFIFELDRSVPKLGEYLGQSTGPRIRDIKTTSTTNSISVEVETRNAEGAEYTYLYKKNSEGEESWKEAGKTDSNSYTINNLESNILYNIKVVVENKEGKAERETSETTGKIPGGEEGVEQGAITFGDVTWTSGKASVTINTNTSYTLEYQVNAITEENWKSIANGDKVTELQHDDTVYARLTDGINHGDYASCSVEDLVKPNTPTITLSGTTGNNGYYKSNVTVKITAGSDNESGANKVKYSVSGTQTVAETTTTDGTTTANVTISLDGTSTISAYTIDKAGNVSDVKTQIVKKDATLPSASITVGTKTENSIKITVSASDATSGLATSGTYKYYEGSTLKTTSTTNSYTFTGLSSGTSYTLKVVVTDKAGNEKTVSTTASTTSLTVENKLKEGDYVTYPSSQGNLACRVLYDSSSGYGIQLITSNSVKNVTLGSSTFSTSMNSYNNAISTLNNEAGRYNNSIYSSRARCVGSHPTSTSDTTSYFTSSYSYMSSYNGQFKNADTNHGIDYNQMGTLGIRNLNVLYWLASRDIFSKSSLTNFCIEMISNGNYAEYNLCSITDYSEPTSNAYSLGLRPVFVLKPTIKVTGGNGTSSSPYTLGV